MPDQIDDFFQSKVHEAFRMRCNGINLFQFSMITVEQFNQLIKLLGLQPKMSVLDVGCGTGGIAHEICRRTGAKVTGIDIAEDLVHLGSSQYKDSVQLRTMSYESLEFLPNSFDRIYCVDALYFTDHLGDVLKNLLELLKPDGLACIFWTQRIEENDNPQKLQPSQTDLAEVLDQLNTTYQAVNFTSEEHAFWKTVHSSLEEFEADFKAEGSEEFFEAIKWESDLFINYVWSNRLSRHLYQIGPLHT